MVANVQPAVMVMPTFMTLAPGPLPNAVTNSVTIQNNSTNRLTLSEPVVNMPGVEATIRELQPGKSFAAMLAFPQGFQVPPGQQVELSVKSSNPKVPSHQGAGHANGAPRQADPARAACGSSARSGAGCRCPPRRRPLRPRCLYPLQRGYLLSEPGRISRRRRHCPPMPPAPQ